MCVQNSCYIPETNPEFTDKFSINSMVTKVIQAISLCCAVLFEQQMEKGLEV